MLFEHMVSGLTWFVREYELWAAPMCFVLAFIESMAFLSLLLPATVLLLAIGTLIGATGISFWPIWLAAALGAGLGDWLAYWIGRRFDVEIGQVWPLSRSPNLLPRARAFFTRWGVAGVFLGRFFGPLRATVPLIAGVCGMPRLRFQVANFASALVWSAAMLAPGTFGLRWAEAFMG
ncbi:MAG TPA: DedA family protein [Acetobacteraceae bacterium]|nr:DedA family protein [Acetobacteraceae bacterium]